MILTMTKYIEDMLKGSILSLPLSVFFFILGNLDNSKMPLDTSFLDRRYFQDFFNQF